MILQFTLHYFLHLVAPLGVAWLFCRAAWMRAYLILLLTMAVDLDHLLASPVFLSCRCSIDFHPLHSVPAISCYVLMLVFPRLRLVGMGLLLHMATDGIDCMMSLRFCP